MGNTTEREFIPISNELKQALKGKAYLQHDINYGDNIKIIKLPNEEKLYAIKIDDFYTEDEFYSHLYALKIRMKNAIQIENFVSVSQINTKNKNLFCTNKSTIYSKYEYIPHSLRSYLNHFKAEGFGNTLDKSEIYYIISTIIELLMKLENFNIFHGNIRPDTILIDNFGELKLTDSAFMLNAGSYHSYLFGIFDRFYVCPSTLKNLKSLVIKPKINYEKSNVFCLGLTILETLTLCDINRLYDLRKNEINKNRLEEYLVKVGRLYDDEICQLLRDMLNFKKSLRYNYQNILDCIKNIVITKINTKKLLINETALNNRNVKEMKGSKQSAAYLSTNTKISNLETSYNSKFLRSSGKNYYFSSAVAE